MMNLAPDIADRNREWNAAEKEFSRPMRESSHDQNIEIIKKRPAWPIKNPERCSQQQRCIKCFYVQRARLQKYNRLFQATLPLTQTPGSILRPAIKGAPSERKSILCSVVVASIAL